SAVFPPRRVSLPTSRLKNNEPPRLGRRRRTKRACQPHKSRIAARTCNDFRSDLPCVFQCRSQYAHAALTQVVVSSASIDGTDARLESDATAVAGRPNDRPDHL